MENRLRLLLASAVTGLAVLLSGDTARAETCPGTVTGTVGPGGPTQTDRICRWEQSVCNVERETPGLCGEGEGEGGGARPYKIHTYTNGGPNPACATFTLQLTSGSDDCQFSCFSGYTGVFMVAYSHGGFNPSNIQANYLGDPGQSSEAYYGEGGGNSATIPGPGEPVSMSIVIPPQGSIDIVVHEMYPGHTGNYTLQSANCGEIGSPLAIQPGFQTISTGAQIDFEAIGGSGNGYFFTISDNQSGGAIDSSTGLYTAGPTGGTDTISVMDSSENTASTTVTVGGDLRFVVGNNVAIAPRDTTTLSAVGGVPPYTFAMQVTGSGSGNVNATTGAYVAGTIGNTIDVVRVTDNAGATATIAVNVGPGLTINPSSFGLAPKGTKQFTVSGGGRVERFWTIQTNASAGATISNTGLYRAGSGKNVVDVIKVTDPLGNEATAQISVGGGLVLTSDKTETTPRGTIQLSAFGGSGNGFAFAIVTNHSGGTVDPTTGVYTAGVEGGLAGTSDELQVIDSNGNAAGLTVSVGPRLSINPPTAALTTGQYIDFALAGGTQPFTATLDPNASAGRVENYRYFAGPNSGRDVITITDAYGDSVSAFVDVTGTGNDPSNGSSGGSPVTVNQPSTNIGGSDSCAAIPGSNGTSTTTIALAGLGIVAVVRRRRRAS